MARLFIQRILKKKNPFEADSNHLHHLLLKKFSPSKVITINSSITLFAILILYLDVQAFVIIFSFLAIYTYFIIKTL